ncbi:hypothetical protein MKX03_013109 [Papaver bracteatum]|nr:hypothetical protein MKX03_013109 [Papaver bracteatum]
MSDFDSILAEEFGYDLSVEEVLFRLTGSDVSEELENATEAYKEYLKGEGIESHMKKIVVLDDDEVCAVCLQDMKVGTVFLKCSHAFHHKCISEWSTRKPNCPLCRHNMRTDRPPNLKRRRLSHDAEELKDETSSTHRRQKA